MLKKIKRSLKKDDMLWSIMLDRDEPIEKRQKAHKELMEEVDKRIEWRKNFKI